MRLRLADSTRSYLSRARLHSAFTKGNVLQLRWPQLLIGYSAVNGLFNIWERIDFVLFGLSNWDFLLVPWLGPAVALVGIAGLITTSPTPKSAVTPFRDMYGMRFYDLGNGEAVVSDPFCPRHDVPLLYRLGANRSRASDGDSFHVVYGDYICAQDDEVFKPDLKGRDTVTLWELKLEVEAVFTGMRKQQSS